MRFSKLLIDYRKKNNLLIKDMASLLNWSRMYYSRFEHDKLFPTKGNIDNFCRVLGCTRKTLEEYIKE